MKVTCTIAVLAGLAGVASADLAITEIYTGISGADGTVDWIEVTNNSGATVDTGNFWYDDSSADINDGGQLDSIQLGAGQSAIFLISDDDAPNNDVDFASAITEFNSIWSYSGFIGLTNGGGGLGQGSDSANLLDSMNIVLSSAGYDSSGALATLDYILDPSGVSSLDVNGAYESNAFFNEDQGSPNSMVTLIGSPGVVPAPGAVALLGLGGMFCARRRR